MDLTWFNIDQKPTDQTNGFLTLRLSWGLFQQESIISRQSRALSKIECVLFSTNMGVILHMRMNNNCTYVSTRLWNDQANWRFSRQEWCSLDHTLATQNGDSFEICGLLWIQSRRPNICLQQLGSFYQKRWRLDPWPKLGNCSRSWIDPSEK